MYNTELQVFSANFICAYMYKYYRAAACGQSKLINCCNAETSWFLCCHNLLFLTSVLKHSSEMLFLQLNIIFWHIDSCLFNYHCLF